MSGLGFELGVEIMREPERATDKVATIEAGLEQAYNLRCMNVRT